MRTEYQIRTMLNEVARIIDSVDDAGGDSDTEEMIVDALSWVLDSTIPDTRITDHLHEVDDDDDDDDDYDEDEDEDEDEE